MKVTFSIVSLENVEVAMQVLAALRPVFGDAPVADAPAPVDPAPAKRTRRPKAETPTEPPADDPAALYAAITGETVEDVAEVVETSAPMVGKSTDDMRAELFSMGTARGFGWVKDNLLQGKYSRMSMIPDDELQAIYANVTAQQVAA